MLSKIVKIIKYKYNKHVCELKQILCHAFPDQNGLQPKSIKTLEVVWLLFLRRALKCVYLRIAL
jgi:hypothetical protein